MRVKNMNFGIRRFWSGILLVIGLFLFIGILVFLIKEVGIIIFILDS